MHLGAFEFREQLLKVSRHRVGTTGNRQVDELGELIRGSLRPLLGRDRGEILGEGLDNIGIGLEATVDDVAGKLDLTGEEAYRRAENKKAFATALAGELG